jgi:hypothetical protein
MKLSPNMKNEFVKEIDYVIDRMKATNSATEKLYYFSATFGIAQRIINFEYDPELVFIHQVLQFVFNTVNIRIGSMSKGLEAPILVPDSIFDKLEESLSELGKQIGQGKKTYEQLEKMVSLAYSTTGNGYYLYQKGMLKI